MDNAGKTIQSSALAALAARAPAGVVSAIKQASARTGVDFSYLMQQASVESGFKTQSKASTSSASGLYQFIDSTWMSMINKYGPQHGLDIVGKSKSEILALRKDPRASSLMAAEFASENEKSLKANWGGKVGSTELYLAHFMGAGQAASFLQARDETPSAPAAVLFPAAAKANRAVFYESSTGKARSVDEVYAFFDRKFQPGESAQTDRIAVNQQAFPKNSGALEAAAADPALIDASSSASAPDAQPSSSSQHKGDIYRRGPNATGVLHPFLYNGQMIANPAQVMILAQLGLPRSAGDPTQERKSSTLFSLYSRGGSYNQ